MKKLQVASLIAAVLGITQAGQAQTNTDLFPLTFRAVCASTNTTGIFRETVGNINLLDNCGVEHNITNLALLTLVYNRTNSSIQVLDTNGVVLCTSFAFVDGLTLTNTNNTEVVFQKNVLVGTNLTATGLISGFARWNPTNLASSYRLHAQLLYTEPAVGTNGPTICHGVLSVGEEEEQEGPGQHHEHGPPGGVPPGNHFGWDQPHNPHH